MFKTLERLQNGEKAFIVCIGDSITEQNYHVNGRLNYVGHFSERLLNTFDRNHMLLNAGIGGNTTWDIIERFERDALRFKPDLLTLMIGINDSRSGIESLPEFKRNLEKIIRMTRENNCEIILLTQNMLSYEIRDNVARRSSYPEFSNAVRETAAAMQVPLCDIYKAWEHETMANPNKQWTLMNDGLHPNEHGHHFMAQTLFNFLGI